MCIATRCTSVDHFVEMFHRFVDEDSFFVSTNNTRPPGLETSFSVQLSDGTPVLRGLCVVLQAWTSAASPFKTPGVRLGIKRLTASSMPVFERLLVTRSKPPPPPPLTAQLKKPDATPTRVESKTAVTVVAKPITGTGEERTPGSSYVLPANPLMNLSDESLEGYVDCTLYEETANYFPAADDGSNDDALVAPPKAAPPASEAEPLFAPRPVTRISAPVEIVTELAPPKTEPSAADVGAEPIDNFQEPSIIIERSPDLLFDDGSPTVDNAPGMVLEPREAATPPPPPPTRQRRPVAPTPAEPTTPFAPKLTPPAAELSTSPIPVITTAEIPSLVAPSHELRESRPAIGFASRESAPAGELAMPMRSVAADPRRKRYAMIAGASALALATIVSISALGAGGDDKPKSVAANAPVQLDPAEPQVAVPEAKPLPEPAPQARPEPEPSPEEPAAEREAAPEENTDPDGDGGVLSAGEGPCRIDVASTPAGSMVYLDGAEVAPSPIALATTCGRHKVDIKHPRYKLLSKVVTPAETAPAKIEVTLQRPTHSVTFTTTPPGATIFIDGRRAGTTPTTVNMLGFSNLKIEIKKTGYSPITTRFYSKVAQDKFSAKMRKW